jgi:hypothetical protein
LTTVACVMPAGGLRQGIWLSTIIIYGWIDLVRTSA